ncbi:MAG: hypothetical protein E4H13_04660 [Calditrichales bacterium]|nr:MAG: hypothetical protein E4H13_04660 [Calditrichales bacterium]
MILIVLGFLLILDNFYVIDFGDVVSTYWPLVLIIIGIKILRDKHRQPEAYFEESGQVISDTTTGRLSESNVFGDIRLDIRSENFLGGSVNNVFGDIFIDLRKAQFPEGGANLSVSGIFGDVTIRCPEDLAVKARTNSVAGDISIRGNRKEGLLPNMNFEAPAFAEASKKLSIQCSIIFGSITIN